MADFIDRALATSHPFANGRYDHENANEHFILGHESYREWLEDLPSADVRPVVTCAECDWHVDCGYHFCNKWCQPCPDNADFYCAYGERPTAVPT